MEASRILKPTACLSDHQVRRENIQGAFGGGIIVVSSNKRKASTTLPGKVEKVIRPHPNTGEPE
jgi:hypothetical protein